MPVHTVVQGECLSSIAKRYGFADWKVIYDHPSNAEFKKKRPNPNLIYPGDRISIPEKEQKEVDCAAGKAHTFKVKQKKTLLRVVLKDDKDQHFGGKEYELTIGNRTIPGTVGDGGLVEQAIDDDATDATLRVKIDDKTTFFWRLKVGHLDPVEEISGVQARLRNLGYNAGPIDGIKGPKLTAALRAFQKKHSLTESGDIDDATRNKLRTVHDTK